MDIWICMIIIIFLTSSYVHILGMFNICGSRRTQLETFDRYYSLSPILVITLWANESVLVCFNARLLKEQMTREAEIMWINSHLQKISRTHKQLGLHFSLHVHIREAKCYQNFPSHPFDSTPFHKRQHSLPAAMKGRGLGMGGRQKVSDWDLISQCTAPFSPRS